MISCSHWGMIEVPESALMQMFMRRIPAIWIEYFD